MGRDGVANIVHELQKRGFDPRRVGADSWVSRCPAHGGADHTLSISRDETNKVQLECRSTERCLYGRIIGAVRLGYDTLYYEIPDSVIRELGAMPIESALSQGAQSHEENGARSSAGAAASAAAETALHTERNADVDATTTEGCREPAEFALEPLLDDCRLSLGERTPFRGAKGDDGATSTGDCPAAWDGLTAGWDGLTIRPTDPLTEADIPPDRYLECPEPDRLDSFAGPSTPFCAARSVDAAPPGEQVLAGPEELVSFDAPRSDHYRDRLERMSAVSLLTHLASSAGLLRSADGRLCAQVPVDNRLEIYTLKSAAFRHWLIDGYMRYRPEPPSGWAISRVVGMLEARARFKGGIPDVFIRVGHTGGESGYYLDLGDSTGRAVAVDAGGWRLVDRPGVDFRRPDDLLPMPAPVRGGSIELLRSYVNLTETDFRLMVAWLTASLRPVGPYPILVLNGPYGSGKSTLTKILRLLVDPQVGTDLALPESTRDMMATAVNGWLLVYENVSSIPRRLSDTLCRLAFGGGFASRALYTDDERCVMYAQRPILLVGIDNFAVRPDLRDRGVFLHLTPIPGTSIRTEDTFWPAFHADYPRILGGVLDAIAGGLRERPKVKLAELPRMADYAVWGEAVARGLGWGAGTFLATYQENRKEAAGVMLEESPVADALLQLARSEPGLVTPVSELHAKLTRIADKRIVAAAGWPKTAILLAREVRRIALQLRLQGFCVTFERRKEGQYITLGWEPGSGSQPLSPAPDPHKTQNPSGGSGYAD